MKMFRNFVSDAGFHVILLVGLSVSIGAWMAREEPAQSVSDNPQIACRYCGDSYSAKLLNGHILYGHHAEVQAETTVLFTPPPKDLATPSQVGVLE